MRTFTGAKLEHYRLGENVIKWQWKKGDRITPISPAVLFSNINLKDTGNRSDECDHNNLGSWLWTIPPKLPSSDCRSWLASLSDINRIAIYVQSRLGC